MSLGTWKAINLGTRIALAMSAVVLAVAIFLSLDAQPGIARPLGVLQTGVVAGVLGLSWGLWTLIRQFKSLEPRWRTALILLTLGNGFMLASLCGMLAMPLGRTTPLMDAGVQASGILTYVSWAAALFTLPSRRMLSGARLPWILDVALIVTAISAAGWFFLVAPQVRVEGRFALWLTFAYPLANLVSVASVVAAIYLGGPFKYARGLLMLGITLNVAGDVIQNIYMLNMWPMPSARIYWLWIACTLVIGIAALQFPSESRRPITPAKETSRPSAASALVTILFLAGLVLLALWGNSARPNTRDVIGLNFGCMVAIFCCLGRILLLVKDNAELALSL
ncbi:MAG: diguanylate cyclase, partial [Burkholderiales bacterium]|nr:diguanylate cyclase [Burkholderiales bacterium]